MTPAGVACLPPCFHGLLEHLRSPVKRATGDRVKSADYVNIIDEDGQPRLFARTIIRRKLGEIAKGKAPGFSGNGPDLYASLPDEWLDWAIELANIIQYSQVTPHDWHIDLIHYVHKGSSDGSLPNHRPLSLVEVFRKVVASVVCDRMKRGFCEARCDQPGVPSGTHDGELILRNV